MAERYDMLAVGHVTHDLLRVRGIDTWFTGGAVYFASFVARRLGVRLLVVTRLAPRDFPLLDGMRREGVEIVVLPGRATTSIENVFETDDPDRRTVRLLAQGDPFRLEDIPEVEAGIYSLGGLFRGEIPDALIGALAARGRVALDLQGVLRTSEDGRFVWKDWADKRRWLPHVQYLKADALEAEVITGMTDRRESARLLHAWGACEVMISHACEVILYDGREICRAPFGPTELQARTGRGDTCFMAYLGRRQAGCGIEESLCFAAALTSLKMESPGPFTGSVAQVLERMECPA